MILKSACLRLAIQLEDKIIHGENGVAVFVPVKGMYLNAYLLRDIAGTLDHLTALQQAKEET